MQLGQPPPPHQNGSPTSPRPPVVHAEPFVKFVLRRFRGPDPRQDTQAFLNGVANNLMEPSRRLCCSRPATSAIIIPRRADDLSQGCLAIVFQNGGGRDAAVYAAHGRDSQSVGAIIRGINAYSTRAALVRYLEGLLCQSNPASLFVSLDDGKLLLTALSNCLVRIKKAETPNCFGFQRHAPVQPGGIGTGNGGVGMRSQRGPFRHCLDFVCGTSPYGYGIPPQFTDPVYDRVAEELYSQTPKRDLSRTQVQNVIERTNTSYEKQSERWKKERQISWVGNRAVCICLVVTTLPLLATVYSREWLGTGATEEQRRTSEAWVGPLVLYSLFASFLAWFVCGPLRRIYFVDPDFDKQFPLAGPNAPRWDPSRGQPGEGVSPTSSNGSFDADLEQLEEGADEEKGF